MELKDSMFWTKRDVISAADQDVPLASLQRVFLKADASWQWFLKDGSWLGQNADTFQGHFQIYPSKSWYEDVDTVLRAQSWLQLDELLKRRMVFLMEVRPAQNKKVVVTFFF